MKKILLLILALGSFGTIQAQVRAGNLEAGADLNLQTSKSSTSFMFSPWVDYFITDHWYAGLSLGVETKTAESTKYTVGIEAGYMLRLANRFYLANQLVVATGKGNLDQAGFEIAYRPVLTYYPIDRMSVNLTIGSLGYRNAAFSSTGEGTFGVTFNEIGIGVGFILRKSAK